MDKMPCGTYIMMYVVETDTEGHDDDMSSCVVWCVGLDRSLLTLSGDGSSRPQLKIPMWRKLWRKKTKMQTWTMHAPGSHIHIVHLRSYNLAPIAKLHWPFSQSANRQRSQQTTAVHHHVFVV